MKPIRSQVSSAFKRTRSEFRRLVKNCRNTFSDLMYLLVL
jgi:hypothetical protein